MPVGRTLTEHFPIKTQAKRKFILRGEEKKEVSDQKMKFSKDGM